MARSTIRGDRELVAALKSLGAGVPVAAIDSAATKSLEPMKRKTKDTLKSHRNFAGKYPAFFPQPGGTPPGGHVDQGIVVKKDAKSSPTRRSYKLGPTKRARPILHLLEYGTAPHYQPNFNGGFMHPGATPVPSITPAYEQHKGETVEIFGREIVDVIENKAKSLGMRTSRGRRS